MFIIYSSYIISLLIDELTADHMPCQNCPPNLNELVADYNVPPKISANQHDHRDLGKACYKKCQVFIMGLEPIICVGQRTKSNFLS